MTGSPPLQDTGNVGPAPDCGGFSAAVTGAAIADTAGAIADARVLIARVSAMLASITGVELATAGRLANLLQQITGELAVLARARGSVEAHTRLGVLRARLTEEMRNLPGNPTSVGAATAGELANLQRQLAALLATLQSLLALLACLT